MCECGIEPSIAHISLLQPFHPAQVWQVSSQHLCGKNFMYQHIYPFSSGASKLGWKAGDLPIHFLAIGILKSLHIHPPDFDQIPFSFIPCLPNLHKLPTPLHFAVKKCYLVYFQCILFNNEISTTYSNLMRNKWLHIHFFTMLILRAVLKIQKRPKDQFRNKVIQLSTSLFPSVVAVEVT